MRVTFFVVLWLSMLSSLALAETRAARYGTWERYSSTEVLRYPDFDLQFVGSKPGSLYPGSKTRRMGDIYTFRISAGDAQREVWWSSGTGNIAAVQFEIGAQSYILEMAGSEVFDGFVSRDQVMLWRASEWERRSKSKRTRPNE